MSARIASSAPCAFCSRVDDTLRSVVSFMSGAAADARGFFSVAGLRLLCCVTRMAGDAVLKRAAHQAQGPGFCGRYPSVIRSPILLGFR